MRRRFGKAAVKLEFIHLFSREFFDHPEIMKLVQEGTGKFARNEHMAEQTQTTTRKDILDAARALDL